MEPEASASTTPSASREMAGFVLAHITDLVTRTAPDGRLLYVSPAAGAILGYEPEELVGTSGLDLVHEEDLARNARAAREALSAGRSVTLAQRVRRKDGRWLWMEATTRALPGGELLSVSRDITARIAQEAELRDREEQLRTLIEQSPYSIQTIAPDGQITSGNRAWERLFGVTIDHLRDYNVLRDPQLEALGVMPLIKRAFEGETHVLPVTSYEPDRGERAGQSLWTRATIYPVKDAAGRVTQAVLMHEDITERVRAERALKAQRDLYERLLEAAGGLGEGVGLTDGERFVYVNDAYARLTGYTVEELSAPSFDLARLVSHRSPELGHARLKAAREGDTASVQYEIWLRRKDGTEIPIELASSAVTVDGRTLRFSLIRDIGRRRAAEAERERFASVVETSSDFIGIGASDGRSMYLNPAGRALVGLGERPLPEHVNDFTAPEMRQHVAEEILPAVLREGRWEGEVALRHFTTGESIPVHQVVFRLPAREGEPALMAVIGRDLRERRAALRELEAARIAVARSERLAAMGTLVSGLAHEVRTPLTIIQNHASLLERRIAAGDAKAAIEIAREIVEASARINRLVGDLRRFTKLEAGVRVRTSLHGVVEEALALFRAAHPASRVIEAALEPTPDVSVDRSQVQQVALNLLQNAVEAMRGREGRIRILTRAHDDGAELVVEDEGPGVPDEVAIRMWEPLFTTKPEGTGLGLSIVRRIVEEHGGSIVLESDAGRGARFMVRFV